MSVLDLTLEAVPTCPLCEAKDGTEFDRGPDTLIPEINRYLPTGYSRLPTSLQNLRRRCAKCGLVFLSPRLDASSLTQVYGLWYGYAYRRVMSDPAHIAERRREFDRYHLRLLERFQPQRGHVLDVGCGSGLFLGLAQRRGWVASGVERDARTAAWAREREDIADLRCGTLDAVLKSDDRFEAVTMFDYLEHTTTPGDDLDRLVGHLIPGGILMIRVPNANGWQARLMGSAWLGVMATHLSYFTPIVLSTALTERNLEILYLRAGNYRSELDILKQRWHWLRHRLSRANPPFAVDEGQSDIPLQPPSPPTGGLGGAARRWLYSMWIEQVDHIGGWFGHGNNLTVIARKTPLP